MDVTTLIWGMLIFGIITVLFKTFVRVEVHDIDTIEDSPSTGTQEKIVIKSIKELTRVSSFSSKQIEVLTKSLGTQIEINKKTDIILKRLVLKIKLLEEEKKNLKDKC